MSFKLFMLQLTGKLKPTAKIEQQREKLKRDYEEYIKVENSTELADYMELESYVNSAAFKKEKAELESLQFKGSREHNLLSEYEKLRKSSHIKKYFAVEGSSDLNRFENISVSEKLKEYDGLLDFIKNGQFAREKKELESQVYKGSAEERHFAEFNKLKKSTGIRAFFELDQSPRLKKHEELGKSTKMSEYLELKNIPVPDAEKKQRFKILKNDPEIKEWFRFENSKKLKLYRETVGNHDLKRYYDLKKLVESRDFIEKQAFLKDTKKFQKSLVYKKYQQFKKLSVDSDIRFFQKYEKSSLRKNYLDVRESFDLKRFNELKEITSSPEFIKRKTYLEDKKKWEKSEAFARLSKYNEMKDLPHLKRYFKYQSGNDFDFLRNWEIIFSDDFSDAKSTEQKWSWKSYQAGKMAGENYALPGDLHIFTDGKNCKTRGKLTIEVKKEKTVGKIWQMPAGFVRQEFEYTSGLVSSWESFWMGDGILEVKVRFNPVKEVVSTIYLQGNQGTPLVHLMEMGIKNRLGISRLDGKGKMAMEGMDISGLKKREPYYFSVERKGKSFIWKINETEVLRLEGRDIEDMLHIVASTLVVNEIPGSQLPVAFEIDGITCYRLKSV